MKQAIFYALAAGLVLSAGCSKKEEPAKVIPKEPVAQQTPAAPAQVTEKVTAIATQAQAITKDVAQKVEAVKSALTVKTEQVMAELNQPVADIKAKVASLGQPELLANANAYKDVILAKKDQLASLTSQLKSLPMSDMLVKGKAIKDQLSQYTTQLSGLKERYGVYLDMLKKLGVDLSSFGL